MKFRWKMLILLLAISLIPLVITAASYYVSTLQLGNRLAASTHDIMTETAHGFLQNLVDDYGQILNRDRELLEVMLTVQARELTRRLAAPPPPSPVIIRNREYEQGIRLPEGMTLSCKHTRPDASGKQVPTPVSYNQQVYFLVRGTDPKAVADDMARLAPMPGFYRTIYHLRPELILWQYVGLESGLQVNYPGAGGFPSDFDQRKRDWYKMAKKAGKLVWGPPVVDALTQITVLTLSMPVYYPDGGFAGVTAIDVLVPGVFQELKLPDQWEALAKIALVAPVSRNKRQKLSITAQMSYLNLDQDWQTPVELEFLESDDPRQLAILIKEAMDGRSGVLKMGYNGRESMWAFGPPGPGNTFPVVIVPYDAITAQAAETRELVLEITRQELWFTGIILLGAVAAAGFLAVLVSRRVTGPVTQLSHAARCLSQGDYQTRVCIRTRDELQDLGDVFNSMAGELKLRQQQLVQADKMASLGVLVAGVAHEINNPNSLILLNLRQLRRAWTDMAPVLEAHYTENGSFTVGGLDYTEFRDDMPEMLEDTEDRARRIKRIVNDLKDFSQRDRLREAFPVDLNKSAKTAVRLMDNTIKRSTRHFSMDLAPDLPRFKGSGHHIEQIVVNFLLNACQSLESEDQEIVLRTGYLARTREVFLDVLDQGPGIASRHLSQVTDPFFTTRREAGGTGLGLSVSAGIAEEHGGRIEFDSELGQGTRARLVLPAEKEC